MIREPFDICGHHTGSILAHAMPGEANAIGKFAPGLD
jgi:hypothetical protein